MKDLKWTLDNFDFYYVGNNENLYSYFNNEIYNKKFKDLIDNDKIILENIKEIVVLWDKLKDHRITFDIFIKKEIEVIYNEIKKAVDVFAFLDEYLKKSEKCFINTFQKIIRDVDTLILVSNGLRIIGMLDENGNIVPLPPGFKPDLDNAIIIYVSPDYDITDVENGLVPLPNEMDMCKKEVTLEEKEYDFC